MLINPFKSKKFFEKKLAKFLYLNQNISKIKKIDNKYKINNELFDYVINSTYYQSFIDVGKKIFYEIFQTQKKRIYNALLSSKSEEVINFDTVMNRIING